MSTPFAINPKADFVFERFIDAPTRLVWDVHVISRLSAGGL